MKRIQIVVVILAGMLGGVLLAGCASDPQYCARYATQSMMQIGKLAQSGQTMSPDDSLWKPDYEHHYTTCLESQKYNCIRNLRLRDEFLSQYSESQSTESASPLPGTGDEETSQPESQGETYTEPSQAESGDSSGNQYQAQPQPPAAGKYAKSGGMTGATGAAYAQKLKYCDQYAKDAMRQIDERKRLRGSLPGNDRLWIDNYNDHYNWCLNASPNQCDDCNKKRAQWLANARKVQPPPVKPPPAGKYMKY